MKCNWHLCDNDVFGRIDKKYCSKKCCLKFAVDRRRKELKRMAVEYLGGKCIYCGYNKYIQAFDFHHREREEKSFGIASNGHTKSWEKLKIELNKCDLVCSNYHREIEANICEKQISERMKNKLNCSTVS